jgi:hypothetical protein
MELPVVTHEATSKLQNQIGRIEEQAESKMAHKHGSEYQVRVIHADGTEELSGWVDSVEQFARVLASVVRNAHGTAYWLRQRSVICPDCFDQEQPIIVECPITGISSPRYRPHDSHYLMAVGSRNRYDLHEALRRSGTNKKSVD